MPTSRGYAYCAVSERQTAGMKASGASERARLTRAGAAGARASPTPAPPRTRTANLVRRTVGVYTHRPDGAQPPTWALRRECGADGYGPLDYLSPPACGRSLAVPRGVARPWIRARADARGCRATSWPRPDAAAGGGSARNSEGTRGDTHRGDCATGGRDVNFAPGATPAVRGFAPSPRRQSARRCRGDRCAPHSPRGPTRHACRLT